MSIIKISHSDKGQLGHRDYLGAILSQGIERECIGDIFIDGNDAYVVVLKPIDEYLFYNLDTVKNIKVFVSIEEKLPDVEKKFKNITINVSSMRLDALVSKLSCLSREKSQLLIQSGNVVVDFQVNKNNSKSVAEGTIITIRGFGKFVIDGIISETKKQRLRVAVRKYSN